METVPDTSGYMIAGYVLTFLVLGIYIFSLSLRTKNLNRDTETLESLEIDSKPQAKKK